jgi:DUF1680 family protein
MELNNNHNKKPLRIEIMKKETSLWLGKVTGALLLMGATFLPMNVSAQTALYPQHFSLHDVTLNASPYKTAMDKNIEVLLEYDVDRLLTPFVRQAGLSATTTTSSKYYQWETKHPNFDNWGWNPSFALDGHVGGHYLSALALAYAASHDETVRAKLKERLEYMVGVLKDCQDAFNGNTDGLEGYVGGLPDNTIWTELYKGSNTQYNTRSAWVPFYVMHKIYAGLRDAYVYAGNETAKECFRRLCDWGINVVAKINDSDMDSSLLWDEQGGMNEVYADAYTLFGDAKYLTAAKKYSHKEMLNGMQTVATTFLNGRHANTQVPKYIGFERISQDEASATAYKTAAENFWTDVANNRTVCIGGNSIDEHFLSQDNGSANITNSDGPESCNSNNMLKLSEDLFDDTHDAKYVDFYEKAMLNHILSTQDPKTGGYVYFTPLRPQSYRIYSQVNSAMWCCVGTGMENHSKYGHFIYTHSADNSTLYVNLFTASTLSSDNFKLEQTTSFPYATTSELTVNTAGTYTIAVRHPAWTTAAYKVTVNGSDVTGQVVAGTASYVSVKRAWSVGDKVDISFPMQLTYSTCPDYTDYVAFNYGPVLLAAQTTSADTSASDYEELYGEYAGEGRMDHAPECIATKKNLTTAPMVLCDRSKLMDKLSVEDTSKLLFQVDATREGSSWTKMELKPFYTIHHTRYMVYWNQQTPEAYAASDLAKEEAEAEALEKRTLDKVATGEQQSEAGHNLQSSGSGKGIAYGEHYRDAGANNWFEYDLATKGKTDSVSLMCRFNINDRGRMETIYIDGVKLCDVTIPQSKSGVTSFYNIEYPVPASMLTGKTKITVKFQGSATTFAPGLYYLRLLSGYVGIPHYAFKATEWVTGDVNRVAQNKISYDETANTISVTAAGADNVCLQLNAQKSGEYQITSDEKYLVVKGSELSSNDGSSFLWFLNGVNKGSSVAPTYQTKATDGDLIIVWDVTKSGLDDNMKEDQIVFTTGTGSIITLFGLTSTATDNTSTIKNINFYSAAEAVKMYSELASVLGGTSGITSITDADAKSADVYTITGVKVASANQTTTDKLPNGLYIRDGKKFVIK